MTNKPPGMPKPRRRLITLKKGLQHLRVGRTKAYELINAGKIIAYKQGQWNAPSGTLVQNNSGSAGADAR
jgi:hypothetical protein